MKRSRILAVLTFSMCVCLVLASNAKPAHSEDTHEGYDPSQWVTVTSMTASFGKTLPNATLLLLTSIAVTGQDGVGRPLHSINLLVVEDGRVLYAFAPLSVPALGQRRTDPTFDIDDLPHADHPDRFSEHGLELKDVTGDHVPEIIFRSGWRAADGWYDEVHVLKYVHTRVTEFRDIRADRFGESTWVKFRWFDRDGHNMAVVAEPVDPEPQSASRSSPKFYRYLVYGWDLKRQQFALRETIPSSRELHTEDVDPFEKDMPYILKELKKRAL